MEITMKALISIAVALFVLGFAQVARAGQVVYTYNFASTSESWTGVVLADITNTYESGAGNPAGSLQSRIYGKNKNRTGVGWLLSGVTWEDLGVPVGATVDSVDGKFDWSCTEYNVGVNTSSSGDLTITDSADANSTTLETAVTFSGTTAYATLNSTGTVSMPAALQASSTSIKIKILGILRTGNNVAAAVTRQMDTVVLTINYTEAAGGRRIIIVD